MSQYDLLASLTEATARVPLRKYFEEYSFFGALGDVRGQSVLDIGCGTGLYTRRLKQRGAARVLGLDASAGMIEYARHLESLHPLGVEYVVRTQPTRATWAGSTSWPRPISCTTRRRKRS